MLYKCRKSCNVCASLCLRIIDYKSYVQHARLYLFVFTRTQAQTVSRFRNALSFAPLAPQALQAAIPAERWEDYCRQVQEEAQREAEDQQAKLEKLKAQEEEEVRAANALAEYTEQARLQGTYF
jgi:hypothetical protein